MNENSRAFDIRSNNWENKDMFPEMIYLDTNSIIEIFAQRNDYTIVESYLKELIERDGMVIWSDHTLKELLDFFHVNSLIDYAHNNQILYNNGNPNWKRAENIMSKEESKSVAEQAMSNYYQVTEEYLPQFGLNVKRNSNTFDIAEKIYSQQGGSIKDAEHVAIANQQGVNDILTQDFGFYKSFERINVFGSSPRISNQYVENQERIEFEDFSLK